MKRIFFEEETTGILKIKKKIFVLIDSYLSESTFQKISEFAGSRIVFEDQVVLT